MLLKRLQAIEYKRGDLISLAGYLGEETFDYPYLIVTKDFTSQYVGGEPRPHYVNFPYLGETELVYPPWSEKMSYSLNEPTQAGLYYEIKWKWLDWGLDWKVWYNGLLYESTKWTKPNVGVPPNKQVTNSGDTAGWQPNLKGELGFEAKFPNPKGYATTITNQSHTFRSWIISEKQPNNPFWEYSNNLSYVVYNNYTGDDSPQGSYTYANSDHWDSRNPPPLDENGNEIPDPNRYVPYISPLPNVFQYYQGAEQSGFAVEQVYSELFESWSEQFVVSGEGREYDYKGKPIKEYKNWSNYGFNPWTGLMPQKDTVCPNPYFPMNAYYDYSWDARSLTHIKFKSSHMFKEALKTTYPLVRTEESQNPIREVVNPAYPPDDQLAISAVQDFAYLFNDADYPPYEGYPTRRFEGYIWADGTIYFTWRGWGGEIKERERLPILEPLTDLVETHTGGEIYTTTDPVGEHNWYTESTDTRTYTFSKTTQTDLYLESYHPLFWLRKVAILENKGFLEFGDGDYIKKSYVATYNHPNYGAIPFCQQWNISNSKSETTYKGWVWKELNQPTLQTQTKDSESNNLGAGVEYVAPPTYPDYNHNVTTGWYYNNNAFKVGETKIVEDLFNYSSGTSFPIKPFRFDIYVDLSMHGCGDLQTIGNTYNSHEWTGQPFHTFKFVF